MSIVIHYIVFKVTTHRSLEATWAKSRLSKSRAAVVDLLCFSRQFRLEKKCMTAGQKVVTLAIMTLCEFVYKVKAA